MEEERDRRTKTQAKGAVGQVDIRRRRFPGTDRGEVPRFPLRAAKKREARRGRRILLLTE